MKCGPWPHIECLTSANQLHEAIEATQGFLEAELAGVI